MNVKEIRRENLAALIDAAGSQAALGRRIHKSAPQINQWLTRNRSISEDTAREIESAVGKPRGWLDTPPSDSPAPAPTPPTAVQTVERLVQLLDRLPWDARMQAAKHFDTLARATDSAQARAALVEALEGKATTEQLLGQARYETSDVMPAAKPK